MYQLGRALRILFVDDDCDLDLGGGHQLDVDATSPQAFEQTGRYARMRSHTDSHHAQLGHATRRVQPLRANLADYRHQDFAGVFQFILVNRE